MGMIWVLISVPDTFMAACCRAGQPLAVRAEG